MDYTQGKIYKIIDETNGDVYIGSTTNSLKKRWNHHHIFKYYNKLKCNCKIILIEDYPCSSKRELEEREQYYIDNTDCINKTDAVMKIDDRIIKTRQRAKKSYHNNKEKRKQQIQSWRDDRRDEVLQYQINLRNYQISFGGDKRYNNNLLMIDPNLFTSE